MSSPKDGEKHSLREAARSTAERFALKGSESIDIKIRLKDGCLMNSVIEFLKDPQRFSEAVAGVEKSFRADSSLPSMVFRGGFCRFGFEQFDWIMTPEFWKTVQGLCELSHDVKLIFAVLDPDPEAYFKREFGYFNWAEISSMASAEAYLDFLQEHPESSPADSVFFNSEKLVLLPPSGKWAIWAERSLEISVLASCDIPKEKHWHDLDWALEVAMAGAFYKEGVPSEFSRELYENYGCAYDGGNHSA